MGTEKQTLALKSPRRVWTSWAEMAALQTQRGDQQRHTRVENRQKTHPVALLTLSSSFTSPDVFDERAWMVVTVKVDGQRRRWSEARVVSSEWLILATPQSLVCTIRLIRISLKIFLKKEKGGRGFKSTHSNGIAQSTIQILLTVIVFALGAITRLTPNSIFTFYGRQQTTAAQSSRCRSRAEHRTFGPRHDRLTTFFSFYTLQIFTSNPLQIHA